MARWRPPFGFGARVWVGEPGLLVLRVFRGVRRMWVRGSFPIVWGPTLGRGLGGGEIGAAPPLPSRVKPQHSSLAERRVSSGAVGPLDIPTSSNLSSKKLYEEKGKIGAGPPWWTKMGFWPVDPPHASGKNHVKFHPGSGVGMGHPRRSSGRHCKSPQEKR